MGSHSQFAVQRQGSHSPGLESSVFSWSAGAAELPKVTVVVPAHNMERYVERALQSAATQTYPNVEIVVIDDGSTDGTAGAAHRFARDHCNVRVITTANAGVAAARNLGLELADSPYVAFLDADDLWAPTKIEKQVAALAAHGHSGEWVACYSLYRVIDEHDAIVRNGPVTDARGAIFQEHLEINHVGNGSSLLVRRDAALSVGGFNSQYACDGVGGCEDFEFQLKLLQHYKIEVVPEYDVGYRIHRSQMSADIRRMALGRLAVIDTIAETSHIPRHKRRRVLAKTHLMRAQHAKRAGDWLGMTGWIISALALSPSLAAVKAKHRLGREVGRLWNALSGEERHNSARSFYDVDPSDDLGPPMRAY